MDVYDVIKNRLVILNISYFFRGLMDKKKIDGRSQLWLFPGKINEKDDGGYEGEDVHDAEEHVFRWIHTEINRDLGLVAQVERQSNEE